jgi:ribonuclease HII
MDEWRQVQFGVDEAGRGPLAGPVIAAAVILPADSPYLEFINDSKKLTRESREKAYDIIASNYSYNVSRAEVSDIEEKGILEATKLAINRAISGLYWPDIRPVLIDGNMEFTDLPYSYKSIISGDSLYKSIAAASIMAKVTRDRLMQELHAEYPQYDFTKNKGYGTAAHRSQVKANGLSPHHRRSFCRKLI